MRCQNLLFLVVAAVHAVSLKDRLEERECEMQWITVYTNNPTGASTNAVLSSGVDSSVTSSVTSSTSSPSSSMVEKVVVKSTPTSSLAWSPSSVPAAILKSTNEGISASTNDYGEPGFPLDGDHLSAPTAPVAVPVGAATYTPPNPNSLSGKAFGTWVDQQKDAKLPSKWLKVAPGTYNYAIDDIIAIGFTPGGWTLDVRDVTFLIAVPQNDKTSGQAIYINQSEDFTILGGTIWFDQGEQWSQAKVTAISAYDGVYATATFEVEQGYNVSVWNTVDPRNQGCIDTTDTNHFTRPDCNFFYVDNYDFSSLDPKKTFTARVTSRANLKVGYHITTIAGPNSPTTIASEFNGNLHVNGMTSNGGLAQYGLTGKVTATFENVWNVNPPARPGFAPRVQGPTLSQAHIGLFDFDAGGDAPVIYKNCFWQTTGAKGDVQDMTDQNLH